MIYAYAGREGMEGGRGRGGGEEKDGDEGRRRRRRRGGGDINLLFNVSVLSDNEEHIDECYYFVTYTLSNSLPMFI